jgi:hypothetical protein
VGETDGQWMLLGSRGFQVTYDLRDRVWFVNIAPAVTARAAIELSYRGTKTSQYISQVAMVTSLAVC